MDDAVDLKAHSNSSVRDSRTAFRSAALFVTIISGIVGLLWSSAWAIHRFGLPKFNPSLVRVTPYPAFLGEHIQIKSPTGFAVALAGTFDDELSAYLDFEYLRSLKQVDAGQVLLTARERNGAPQYRVYLVLENDLLADVPFLSNLQSQRFIPGFEVRFVTGGQVEYARAQTRLFSAIYSRPVQIKLEQLPAAVLANNVARFILFKAKTDRRAREEIQAVPSREQARELAADILAVSNFYSIPPEFFLGVGAMENNFIEVRGDLEHKVWKRRSEPGDIVLKRRRHRVLVLNYSVGVWQITRETLRYAQKLYLKDKRDYSELPERLVPPKELDFERVDSHVLTTYAGLLIRDLIDRFHGDVTTAIGAYNGGPRNPNLEYSAGVTLVADYARRVLQQASLMHGREIANARFVFRRK